MSSANEPVVRASAPEPGGEHQPPVVRPITVGEMREMCEGLPNDAPIIVMAPGGEGEDDWHRVDFDISASLFPDRCFVIEVSEGVYISEEAR